MTLFGLIYKNVSYYLAIPISPPSSSDENFLICFFWIVVKLGQPRWNFVEYGDSNVRPPKRTGHTLVTHGDCLYV